MKSLNVQEVLWNKLDKIRIYDKSMIEVYSGVRRIVELEVSGSKTYLQNLKAQIDLMDRLETELKKRSYFLMISDSFKILKDLLNRRLNKQKDELDKFAEQIFNPLTILTSKNDEILQLLSVADKNLASLMELGRGIEDKYHKYCKANLECDMMFEEEQIKDQVKTLSFKFNKKSSSKLQKAYEKAREEEKQYKSRVDAYNRNAPALLNENVRMRVDPGRYYRQNHEIFYFSW
jgi:hypothetical protein